MSGRGKYPVEVRERAVRLVLEHRRDYPSQWAAISSIASKCGMTTETLRKWVRRAEVDSGGRVFPLVGLFCRIHVLGWASTQGAVACASSAHSAVCDVARGSSDSSAPCSASRSP